MPRAFHLGHSRPKPPGMWPPLRFRFRCLGKTDRLRLVQFLQDRGKTRLQTRVDFGESDARNDRRAETAIGQKELFPRNLRFVFRGFAAECAAFGESEVCAMEGESVPSVFEV